MKFKIIAKEIYDKVDGMGVVLAKIENENYPFVTWEFRRPDFYFKGHYYSCLDIAMQDYHERLARNYKEIDTPWEV